MPFVYMYSPNDFILGLPDEVGAMAAGTPMFVLVLAPSATPTLVEISDDDAIFDEVDASQFLTNSINLDGTAYAAGTTAHSSYDLINTTSGHKVTGVHLGGDGYQQGPVQGLISTVELVYGVPYTFDVERTSHQQNNPYSEYVPCLLRGTLIETDTAEIPVEDLESGDRVKMADGEFRPLRLKLNRKVCSKELEEFPKLFPIRITAGSMAANLPKRDLLVSRQHRMLLQSKIAERMFATSEVLIPAIKLVDLPGIFVDETVESVEYFHLVFDQHEVIYAEGAPTESLFTGPQALKSVTPEAREEILTLFPEVKDLDYSPKPARFIPTGKCQKKLIARHLKNRKPCLSHEYA